MTVADYLVGFFGTIIELLKELLKDWLGFLAAGEKILFFVIVVVSLRFVILCLFLSNFSDKRLRRIFSVGLA